MDHDKAAQEPARLLLAVKVAELQYKVAYTNNRLAGEAMSVANQTAAKARDLWYLTERLLGDAEADLHRALGAEADA